MKVFKPAASDIVLGNGLYLADVTGAVGSVAFDFRSGAVNEFTIPIVDSGRKLLKRGLLREGTTLRYQGQPWQVAAVEREYRGDDVWLTVTCRSRLARRLRNMTGPRDWKDTTARAVITSLVKKAGGVAVVEPGAKLKKLVQKRNQSVLDLIASVASDTGTEWVEIDGTLYVGTPWWAYQGRANLPLWNANVRGLNPNAAAGFNTVEAVAFSSRSSLDDRQNAAEASLTVTTETGVGIRPWHRMNIAGADETDNGTWLVTGSSWDDMSPGVQLTLQRPLKSSPKNGSTGNAGGGDGATGGDLPDLGPIEGSSYRDAQRPSSWRGRSVAGMVSLFKANPNGLNHRIYNGCLWYAQEVAGYPHVGANPEVLAASLGSRLIRSKTVVPGAVLLYGNRNIGHAVAYIGGGRCIGTDMDSSGRYVVGKWAIASVDAMERSFGVSFLGWYAP